jgi:hypothetical protein
LATIDVTPKFSTTQFNAAFQPLVTFFRAKLGQDIATLYYNRLKIYPIEAVTNGISKWITNHKPMSSNFPTPNDICNECSQWLGDHPEIKHDIMVYDPIDDPEYPMDFLFDAYRILCNLGEDAFNDYCTAKRMPQSDRDKVMGKWRFNNDDEYRTWAKEKVAKARTVLKRFGDINEEEVPF